MAIQSGTIINLLDNRDGSPVCIDEGESLYFSGTFVDGTGGTILEANVATIVLDLYNEDTAAIINSRTGVNVKDTNGGVLGANGEFSMTFTADDAVIVSSDYDVGDKESHIFRLTWTWNDGVTTQTAIQEYRFRVRKLASPS